MRKYLLSTGIATDKFDEYVVDLFRLYLQVWPGEIPGMPKLGFDFILTDVRKPDLKETVSSRLSTLANTLEERLGSNVSIRIDDISIVSESKVKITITVNNTTTSDFEVEV